MINGRILMTEDRLQRLVIEAVAMESRTNAIHHLEWCINDQCHDWHFGPADRQLLSNEIYRRYDTYEKFFDKPNERGTE